MPVLLGKCRACSAHTKQSSHQEVKSIPHLKHQCSVDRILACGAPMDELLRLTFDVFRQNAYKRNCGCASRRSFTVQSINIEQLYLAIGCNGVCDFLWDDPGVSFCMGQRGLKCEDPPHMCLCGKHTGHLRRAEQVVNRLRHVALPFLNEPFTAAGLSRGRRRKE